MKMKMLKLVLSVSVFILGFLPFADAQKLSFGPMVGANIAKISDVPNSKSQIGPAAGVFLNYSVNENIGFGLKGLFSQLGTSVDNSSAEVKLNYVQIPLSGVYFFGERGNIIRPKIFLGPYVGFLLSAKDQNGTNIVDSGGQDVYNNTDFGGQIGVGFNYSMNNNSWINFDAGYATSLVNITDHSSLNHKNNFFFVSLGYSFPISQ